MTRIHLLATALALGLALAGCNKPESPGRLEAAQHAEAEPAETGTIALTDQEIKETRIRTEQASEREVA